MPRNKSKPLQELPTTGKVRWNQLAPFMPISRETFRRLAIEGKAPPPIRFSLRCTMFDASECHKWLADPMNYTAPPKPSKPQPTPEA